MLSVEMHQRMPKRLVAAFALLAACTQRTAEPRASTATTGGESDEAALARARAHPIAHPSDRPLYPEKTPPPRPAPTAPTSAPPDTSVASTQAALEATPAPAPERVVAPQAPPAPREEVPPRPPEPTYVWAPGYWYWYGGRYVWVDGVWLRPRRGYTYVTAGWVYDDAGWVFWPAGWAVAGTSIVVYPVYRHHYLHHHRVGVYRYPSRGYYRPHGFGRYRSYRGATRSYRGGTTRAVMRHR